MQAGRSVRIPSAATATTPALGSDTRVHPPHTNTRKHAHEHTNTHKHAVGGGVNPDNAKKYIDAGASHVIVTSYVFKNGTISFENLEKLVPTIPARTRHAAAVLCPLPQHAHV